MRAQPRHSRRARGNAIVQMVIVTPLILAMAFGVAEYGSFYWIKSCVRNAAAVGARAAVPSNATNASVQSAVDAAMQQAGLQSSGYTTTVSPANMLGLPTGQRITVTVTCNWSTVGLHALPSGMGGIPTSKQVICAVAMNRE